MNIFLDESGSFVKSLAEDSWNCVATYISPEIDSRALAVLLRKIKNRAGYKATDEIKLKDLNESQYAKFLDELSKLNGSLIAIATDSGKNTLASINSHKKFQCGEILANKPKMIFPEGKEMIQQLADDLNGLSYQLYVQLQCQAVLLSDTLRRGILYYVQRRPATLSRFRWFVDQKNTEKTVYENTFESMAPVLLQSAFIREPFVMLAEANYSYMKDYRFTEETAPTYLKDEHGIETSSTGLNLGRILQKDLDFGDSKKSVGLQVVDLLVSGLRRCLRGGFDNNDLIAKKLGSILIRDKEGSNVIKLVSFLGDGHEVEDSSSAVKAIQIMESVSKPMLL